MNIHISTAEADMVRGLVPDVVGNDHRDSRVVWPLFAVKVEGVCPQGKHRPDDHLCRIAGQDPPADLLARKDSGEPVTLTARWDAVDGNLPVRVEGNRIIADGTVTVAQAVVVDVVQVEDDEWLRGFTTAIHAVDLQPGDWAMIGKLSDRNE